jgi:hypothetical protein
MIDCGAQMSKPEGLETAARAGTFEPLRAGDRQRAKRVAKARNPLKTVRFEVSLS